MPCSCHVLLIPLVCLMYQSSHLSHNTEPWHYAHGLVSLIYKALHPCVMHRHVGSELIAYLVIPSSHDTVPMASRTSSMHKSLGILVPT